MHRIDTPTAQKDKFGAGKNGFTRGNPQTGTPATDLDDDYFDMLQEELAGVVEATGVVLDKSKHNQLLTALKSLLLSRAHPFADIKADGSAAVAEALTNLGIGEAAKLGVATNSQMAAGTATNLLPSVAAVMSLFSKRNFATKDYIRIPDVPGGLIIQFGTSVISATSGSLAFATPFPNSALAFVALKNGSDGRFVSYSGLILNGVSVYGFLNTTPTNIDTFNWLAIGY
ncbi:hypothetical protein OM095_09150 [Enterobacter roggenkampii]|uniref:gp53-like domain-containing protein n=1 Tax=Enterobacter roggenkampii TaxID=1812935 RepID=UPI00240D88E0|nr:hypothetical protein [Enterobacter roggenkampii]WFC80026.1 hypothetical protein OM095_09150 [Enterobacter roggenkampii]